MLTHLIRNLLTNAMLHGKPPVTVLLYGVQTLEEAKDIPDFLLQTVLCSSFIDYNSSDFYSDEASHSTNPHNHKQDTALDNDASAAPPKPKVANSESIVALPAPPIYQNGENVVIDADPSTDNESDSIVNQEGDSATLDQVEPTNTNETLEKVSNSSLFVNYHSFTSDLTDKLKKVMWRAVPEKQTSSETPDHAIEDTIEQGIDNNAINSNKENANKVNKNSDAAITESDKSINKDSPKTSNTIRKESLFSKHLKKSKPEPTRPLPTYVVLAVIDEGDGIPENKREEVFSTFVRLQQKNKGSGLGLSLVSQIVTAHQGRITTDTINGHTRFLVVLPVKLDPHYNHYDHL